MTRTQQWGIGAAVIALLILLAGWFLLISPARSDAAELRDSAVAQERANASLVSRIEELKTLAAGLPEQHAKLEELGVQIPTDPALPTLIRDLTSAAEASGSQVVSIAPASPMLVPSSVPVPVAAPAASEGTESATTPVAAAPASDPLYMVPLTVELGGSFIELEQFVDKLEELPRAFLVTGFTLEMPAGEQDEDSIKKGPLKLTLTGRVFVEAATAPATVSPAPVEAPATGTAPESEATPPPGDTAPSPTATPAS